MKSFVSYKYHLTSHFRNSMVETRVLDLSNRPTQRTNSCCISLLYSSTCFELQFAQHQEVKTVLYSNWYHHTQQVAVRYRVLSQPVHRTATYLMPVMTPDAVQYNFDLLMMSAQCSKQIQRNIIDLLQNKNLCFIIILKPCNLYLLYAYVPTKLHLNLLN